MQTSVALETGGSSVTFAESSGVLSHILDGKSMSIEVVRESTEEFSTVSTQHRTSQIATHQASETSARQTVQASAELGIEESTDRAQRLSDSSIEQTDISQSLTQAASQTSAAFEIRDSSAISTHPTGQYGGWPVGEVVDLTMLSGGLSVQESVTGEIVRESAQEFSRSSTQISTQQSISASMQQATQLLTQQTTQISTQHTAQSSAELEIGASTNHVQAYNELSIEHDTQTSAHQTIQSSTRQTSHTPESTGQYCGQVGVAVLDVSTIPTGQSARDAVLEEIERQSESTEEINQSPSMLTVQTNDAPVIQGGVIVDDYVRGARILTSVGEKGRVVRELEEDKHSSVVAQTVMAEMTSSSFEPAQEATGSTVYDCLLREVVQTSTQKTPTVLETTSQVALTECNQYGSEQSHSVVTSVQNILSSQMQEAFNNTVNVASATTELNIQPCEFAISCTRTSKIADHAYFSATGDERFQDDTPRVFRPIRSYF